ncbi:hypothetical protein BDN72DRAFT_836165 [Pluteus cervinus]|uniref:Uncharacterized protein n=1 Tax=Pluteus cervinus TaxID=181527 RepID=A0ACD3B4Q1_9AGAR|nr:hypothetical protein BDN72DRAFT_836165 [Pluteus cervinus]
MSLSSHTRATYDHPPNQDHAFLDPFVRDTQLQHPSTSVSYAKDSDGSAEQQQSHFPAQAVDTPSQVSRSASSTSSLDPYYFGTSSPVNSFAPQVPGEAGNSTDSGLVSRIDDAQTAIDPSHQNSSKEMMDSEGFEVVHPQDGDPDDDPDSPWTIEAIDGELSDKDEPLYVPPLSLRPLRGKSSIPDESGGEEILYPRKLRASLLSQGSESQEAQSSKTVPPSAFMSPLKKAKKRTSDEFEMDQTGELVSKRGAVTSANKERLKDDKQPRKHRSLTSSSNPSLLARDGKTRDRRSANLTSPSTSKLDRPLRHTSTSSTSSDGQTRRVQTSDFSHLPPSPSSSSIQHFLRQSSGPYTPPLTSGQTPSVVHSLLRGTQEGWSGLDDEATAEALRKLDGLSGKGARARMSVGSLGRGSNSSRPGTPAKINHHWEGLSSSSDTGKSNVRRSIASAKESGSREKDASQPNVHADLPDTDGDASRQLVNSDASTVEKLQKVPATARNSFTPKRGSTSSTTYTSTPTTSSRDSASMSAVTSITSLSGTSRLSSSKTRRNSAGSDVSSVHSGDHVPGKDRTGDSADDRVVPPVPPLPKDFSSYRSPPPTSSTLNFPITPLEEKDDASSGINRAITVEGPTQPTIGAAHPRRQSQPYSSGYTSTASAPESLPPVAKTPSKKWSFSSALNLKLTSSPSAAQKPGFSLSPRAITFGQQLRKSTSKDHPMLSGSQIPWSQPTAMTSAASLTSLSSVGSVRTPALTTSVPSKTPDHAPEVSPSSSTHHTLAPTGPLSPASSVRRAQSKRLTPSSIPFFRRSSSQSMQTANNGSLTRSSSPSLSTGIAPTQSKSGTTTPPKDGYASSASTSTHKKSSVLSLGLPSLLKGSSSRRSLHNDSKGSTKEAQKHKDAEKDRSRQEKEKSRKDEKDRSESRISSMISRKRGKTLSSTEPRKPKSPVTLPPMQISALEPATAQRVARLKSSNAVVAPTPVTPRTSSTSSKLTSHTASSMQKQSDSSLRARSQLPTIAGSPSVGALSITNTQSSRDITTAPTALHKETPTKIPRISSRTSAAPSPPPPKSSGSTLPTRRGSSSATPVVAGSNNPSPTGLPSEFGVIESNDVTPSNKTLTHPRSIRGSPSRVPRHSSSTIASTGSVLPRKSTRDSISFTGLRKSSTSSVNSVSTPAASDASYHRFSALSPSKGLKLLSPKISLPTARTAANSNSQPMPQATSSPASSRQSLSTPSPVPSMIDEEELLGDAEMMHYIKRQQAKKLAVGATQEELDAMLRFPEPIPPGTPSSPSTVLKGTQIQYLSEYERKEILDYPSIYFTGARSKKKLAMLDIPTNNYGYDDERGDYLVVNHDHLAYRYEVVDTLGKGSFGQVLHCRDHCTGESVAIKIIRNKKRFHHQALVEIKILDNLRKWDADERHHVIKMTEHFYFRNHLCIAMELLSINLYELIKANGFSGFSTSLIRRFTTQMLRSLSLMRHHRIVHCDLKPENVLLRHPTKSAIKVIDFGSSCFEHEKIYTYIQSRFYRSPEVILGLNYHMAIDMWSLGCILAELYTGYPIFPGENEQEQLLCIMEVLGIPEKDFVNRSSRKKLFFDPNGAPRITANSKGRRRRPGSKTIVDALRHKDKPPPEEEFVDFISKCLMWDPERRLKPQAAMRHPFVTAGRIPRPSTTTKPNMSSSSLSGSKSKMSDTPKKSLISAPTPLTARSSRTAASSGGLSTPSSSHTSVLGSASRSFRASQSHSLSTYQSNRTLSGFATTSK